VANLDFINVNLRERHADLAATTRNAFPLNRGQPVLGSAGEARSHDRTTDTEPEAVPPLTAAERTSTQTAVVVCLLWSCLEEGKGDTEFSKRLGHCDSTPKDERLKSTALPLILDMQHPQLLGILPSLGPPEQPDHNLLNIRAGLVRANEGKNVVVMAGDDPPAAILQGDRAEVAERRPDVNRAVFLKEGGGLGSQIGLRLHEDDASTVLEQHPRFLGCVDGSTPRFD
jgi:hypothetical protein